ncbi:probable E3 ubiquitin-protein ligase HECTD2 [Liolophura sinensis]|uniref:probable E3 ubiquitin-protein ligase HECTD2 n=1 Tax=Liolophura sinensis TaxID=3198878 RepID=UPI003158964F
MTLSSRPMASKPSEQRPLTALTCSSCEYTVGQAQGTKRTICPNCGNFYDRQTAVSLRMHHTNRTRVNGNRLRNSDGSASDKEKSGGRLQTIANFFQNLTPNRKTRNNKDSGSRSLNATPGSEGRTELPPISSDVKHQLTVHNGRSPSASPSRGHVSALSPQTNVVAGGKSPLTSNRGKVIYPIRTKTTGQLEQDIKMAKEKDDWTPVQEFYATTFDSFLELNALFKRDPNKEFRSTEDCGLKQDLVDSVLDHLLDVPQEIQKVVLKCIINSMLKDKRPHTKDDLRAYLILLQNPQFNSLSTYVIFAHLLRQVAALTDHDHHYLVHWLRKLPVKKFKDILQRLHNFIACRLFPPKQQDLPALAKCTWWIPSATKVLALINAANNLASPLLLPYPELYNSTLDHLDLMAEYYAWQNQSSHAGFSFCQYPFILSIAAKRNILQRDSEQQMIIMARRSLVAKVQRRQLPDIGMLFLNLNVRRTHLVSDSLNEIARKQHDLKKKLKVTFAGEPGLDMGGLTKEWFLLLVRQIFQPEYGMFVYDKKAGVYWFSTAACENCQEFNLVGVLMGLAVYNSIILDIRFPQCCYKKLLSPAVVPYNNPRATVGVVSLALEDLKGVQPDVAHGLQELLDYEGNVEDDFCLTFQISFSELGQTKTHNLKTDGDKIPVTNKNRKDYVQRYVDYVLNKAIFQQFQAFYHGFHSVCASNALIMLRPEEVETLVCGNPNLDMAELKKVTVYDGFHTQDQAVRYFWELVLSWSKSLQKRLLLFTTGSDRIPIGGMSEMSFKITKVEDTSLLPMAHTCFNQLVLPAYKNRKILKQKLILAIQNAEGFGLE